VNFKFSQRGIAAMLAAILCASLAAGCDSAPQPAAPATAANPAEPAVPDTVVATAKAAYGTDAEVLAYGDFWSAGGQQALVVRRLAATAVPGGAPAPAAASPQSPETTADVIHVSILVRDGSNWKEAFSADEHLKNRRGYLAGSPAAPVPAWRLGYEKTEEKGFLLSFTPLNLSPGSKQSTVRVAWNPKLQEYDSLDASGTQFQAIRSTPGGESVKMKP